MDWLHTISSDPDSRKHAAEASGFLEALSKFDSFLKLEILRIVFTIIEDSNTALRAAFMNFRKAEDTIKLLKTILLNARCDDRFQLFWEGALKSLEKYKLEEPVLPRKRKVPARHDGQGEHHFSANPEDHYRALYFQTLDDVIMGLTTRFEPTESSIHLSEVEKFIIGECDVSYIKDFYKDDFEDYARLQLHRDIVADKAKSKNVKLENFESALQLMKDIPTLVPLVSEFAKLLRIILCMPVSTCTAERSFSVFEDSNPTCDQL